MTRALLILLLSIELLRINSDWATRITLIWIAGFVSSILLLHPNAVTKLTLNVIRILTRGHMQPIDNLKQNWWQLWSVRLNLIGATLLSAFMAWPDLLLGVWNSLPDEVKIFLPPRLMFILPLLFFAAATAARIIKQTALEKTDGKDA